ncbi:hypothetical protein H4O18_09615 [Arenibacter sp. BSSL-BM3]|uniref:Uncharacterized protein n=1 Tax=Arenibacter arenosicollis TaxID=2762274 RepID=A0ABR7QM29_9FLAO|nr:hypothetical protein [Arenibacter arenosicollis]MBC8768250.1 hypothetical protein [Arenibacter arenosicollis]
MDTNIMVSSMIDGQIIDEVVKINATINSTEGMVEVFIDSQSIYSSQNTNDISLDFNPESYNTGSHVLKIILTNTQGKTKAKELNFEVHRRLISINLPEKMINQYIINAVAFASKMDGTLISAKTFTNDDNVVTLSSLEEFGSDEEFMLTFATTDNGSATGMSTHANLTRNNPGVINLKKPFRGQEGSKKNYPTKGFTSGDRISSWNLNVPYNSDYRIESNIEGNNFTVTIIDDIDGDNHDPEIFYLYNYDFGNYQNIILYPPLPENFVLDKTSFTSDDVETHSIFFNSSHSPDLDSASLLMYGYWTANDYAINNFQLIDRRSQYLVPGNPLNYHLNTNFYAFRYSLQYQNYYASGIGIPESSLSVPDNTLDFTFSNNKINFDITGTDHIIGRIRLNDGGNYPIYVWDVTFNSKTSSSLVLPELPIEMDKSNLLRLYKDNLMQVTSTELVSYRDIEDYDEYLQKVIKNHIDPLKVSGGQELIFKANVPFHDGPIKDFPFR